MTLLRFFACGLVLAGVSISAYQAVGQAPGAGLPPGTTPPVAPTPSNTPSATIPPVGPNTTFIPGSSAPPTVVEQSGEGQIIRYGIVTGTPGGPGRPGGFAYGMATMAADPESAKLLAAEHAAAQEARDLTLKFQAETSDTQREALKMALKDKLKQVFELQQQRRTSEITRIEERLAKLKETMKKREGNKDAIVSRRLDELTGGVDALGWEETGGSGQPGYSGGYPDLKRYPMPLGAPPAGGGTTREVPSLPSTPAAK
jgi:hypothetical protein